jgi:hypothetical protein
VSPFFDFDQATPGYRNPRTMRRDEYLDMYRLLEAHQDAILPAGAGGGTDVPARTPRTQRRTSARKPASNGAEDGDGDGPAFTINTSPSDGIILGAAAFCTTFMLMAQYGGKAIVPIEAVCADYFAPLTLPNLRRKIASGDIPLPLVRMEAGSKKASQGVHLQDLADYIDERRAAAVKERDQLCN